MQGAVRQRVLLFLLGLIVIPLGTVATILFARGYRPSIRNGQILPTGLLVANSYPDGAQVYVDGQLKSATNTTINLSPGSYKVEIKKEGYQPWQKTLSIEQEIVTRATSYLFPSVPAFKAITANGVANPILSPDGTKVAFSQNLPGQTSSQLFILDLSESPLGLLNREARQVATSTRVNFSTTRLFWSPDSRQIIALASSSAYLTNLNSQPPTDITLTLSQITSEWSAAKKLRDLQKMDILPDILKNLLATSAADLLWSPRENKLLYTATAAAQIPGRLIRPLPGSSTQTQNRTLTPRHYYVYDLEEDRNFEIGQVPTPTPAPKKTKSPLFLSPIDMSLILASLSSPHPSGWSWFPNSQHLIRVDDKKVTVMEYDGQNSTVIYAGPLESHYAFPYPSSKQLLILANMSASLSASQSSLPNLFAVTLR